MALLHEEITGPVIEAFYQVHRELGHGFLESVYSRAMVIALADVGIHAQRELEIEVWFRERRVGVYRADLVVEGKVILENKASAQLPPTAESQLINLLRSTSLEVGLLLHFGQKPKFTRRILTNDQKAKPFSA